MEHKCPPSYKCTWLRIVVGKFAFPLSSPCRLYRNKQDMLWVSGIMALCATSSYYDVTEIATRILPNIVVLTIDPDRYLFFLFVGISLVSVHLSNLTFVC